MTNSKKIMDILETYGLNNFRDIIMLSIAENREYGFVFYSNGDIEATDICVGEKCKVEIDKYSDDKKTISTFHTHLINTYLSSTDIYMNLNNETEFACISILENNIPTIKCYTSPYGVNEKLAKEFINILKKYNEIVYELNTTTNIEQESIIIEELSNLHKKYINIDTKLRIESREASRKLSKKPNNGADLIIQLK